MRETVKALAGHVGLPHARLEAVLPPELLALVGDSGLSPVDPTAAYIRVANAARMHVAIAIEVVRAAVAELGYRLGADGRAELRGVLPREWADLVVEPSPARADGTSD